MYQKDMIIDKATSFNRPPTQSLSSSLFFLEAATKQPIHIVGTMHYNPYSINKVTELIHDYGSTGRLGSVVIESCEERWSTTQRIQPKGSILRWFLDNEFQAAAELAEEYDVRMILADENISKNNERINSVLTQTVQDLFAPPQGWNAILSDLQRGWRENIDPQLPTNSKTESRGTKIFLDRSDLFDVGMLQLAPISLARYVLGFVAKKPLPGTLLLGWLAGLIGYGIVHGIGSDLSLLEEVKATTAGLVLNLIIGVPLLGRVLLVTLLGDRNEIIARNIRDQCRILQGEGRREEVVLVVLGLAHCNGVKRLLCKKK